MVVGIQFNDVEMDSKFGSDREDPGSEKGEKSEKSKKSANKRNKWDKWIRR